MMPSVIVQADRQLPSIITRSPVAAALCILSTYIGINPPPSLVIVRALAGSVQSRVEAKISFFIIFPSRDLIARKFYASNFEQIKAQTLPELAKPSINTTT
jgi:hypothetical protein